MHSRRGDARRPRRRVLRIPDWLHEPPLDWTGSQGQARPETARSIAHTITLLVPPQPVTRDANPGFRWNAYGTFNHCSVGPSSIEMTGLTHVLTPRVLESDTGASTSWDPGMGQVHSCASFHDDCSRRKLSQFVRSDLAAGRSNSDCAYDFRLSPTRWSDLRGAP